MRKKQSELGLCALSNIPWWLLAPTCSCGEVLASDVKLFLNGNGILVIEAYCQKCSHRCDIELPLAELIEVSSGRPHPGLLVGSDCIAKLVKNDANDRPERLKKVKASKENIWDTVATLHEEKETVPFQQRKAKPAAPNKKELNP